jgi:hypothetical protein
VKSRYSALGEEFKARKGKGAAPTKKVAKSQDKETYAQTTVYLHRTKVYEPLQSALAKKRLEYSQLVEDLLADWLSKQ